MDTILKVIQYDVSYLRIDQIGSHKKSKLE